MLGNQNLSGPFTCLFSEQLSGKNHLRALPASENIVTYTFGQKNQMHQDGYDLNGLWNSACGRAPRKNGHDSKGFLGFDRLYKPELHFI
jgi:hypothetical protein